MAKRSEPEAVCEAGVSSVGHQVNGENPARARIREALSESPFANGYGSAIGIPICKLLACRVGDRARWSVREIVREIARGFATNEGASHGPSASTTRLTSFGAIELQPPQSAEFRQPTAEREGQSRKSRRSAFC